MITCKDFFRTLAIGTGTPSDFCKAIARDRVYSNYRCGVIFSEAVKKGYICRPQFNLIHCSFSGIGKRKFASAIVSAVNHEINLLNSEKANFPCRMLVNVTSIDFIDLLRKEFKYNVSDVHLIGLHSQKKSQDKDGNQVTFKPFINDIEVTDDIVYKVLKYMDDYSGMNEEVRANAYNELSKLGFENILDGSPIIVFQIGMISEGVNIHTFNSVIVTSHQAGTLIQQIGRAVRLGWDNLGYSKKEDSHCSVYFFYENNTDITTLIKNLESEDLTSDCFDWGPKLEMDKGSSPKAEDDDFSEVESFNFDPIEDIQIELIESLFKKNHIKKSFLSDKMPLTAVEALVKRIEENGDLMNYLGFKAKKTSNNSNGKKKGNKKSNGQNSNRKTSDNTEKKISPYVIISRMINKLQCLVDGEVLGYLWDNGKRALVYKSIKGLDDETRTLFQMMMEDCDLERYIR